MGTPSFSSADITQFTNTGTVNLDTTNAYAIDDNVSSATFDNQGTVNVLSGSQRIGAGGVDSGLYTVANGATLNFGMTHIADFRTLNAGVAFETTPGGTLRLSYGGLVVNTDLTLNSLTLAGGTLSSNNSITITETLDVIGSAQLVGSGTFTTSGTTNISTGYLYALSNKPWNNSGTINVSGDGYIRLGSSSSDTTKFTNTGTVNLDTTNAYAIDDNVSSATFDNQGTVNVLSGTQRIQVDTVSTGTLHVAGGTLSVPSGNLFTQSGVISTAAGATFSRTGNWTNTGTISGLGTLDIGTSTLTNSGLISPGPLTGSVGSTGTLTLTGNLAMTSTGTLSFDVSTVSADLLQVNGTATLNGTLSITDSSVSGSYAVLLVNGGVTGTFANVTLGQTSATVTYPGGVLLTFTGLDPYDMWDGDGGDGLWTNALNWTYDLLPTESSNVAIGNGFTVNLGDSRNIFSLALGSGASLTLAPGSTLAVSSATSLLSGSTLTINGASLSTSSTLSSQGVLQLTSGGTLSLQPGATANILGDLSVDATSRILNTGALLTITPSASGNFSLLGGLATFYGGTTHLNTANLSTAPTLGTLWVGTNGNDTFATDGTLSLAGDAVVNKLHQDGGTLNVATGSTLSLAQKAGVTHWLDYGTWTGGGTISLDADADLRVGQWGMSYLGNIQISLASGSHTVWRDSTAVSGSASLQVSQSAYLDFDTSGRSTEMVIEAEQAGTLSINNAGLISVYGQTPTRLAGWGAGNVALSGTGDLSVHAWNDGTTDHSGQLTIGYRAAGALTGNVAVDAASTLAVSGGTLNISPTGSSTLDLQGTLATNQGGVTTLDVNALSLPPTIGALQLGIDGSNVTDGTLNLAGQIQVDHFKQDGGTLNVSPTSNLSLLDPLSNGTHQLHSGTWTGGGTVSLANGAQLTFGEAPGGAAILGDISLNLGADSTLWVMQSVNVVGNASINVGDATGGEAGASLDLDSSNITAGLQIVDAWNSGSLTIHNNGTVSVYGAAGTALQGSVTMDGAGELFVGLPNSAGSGALSVGAGSVLQHTGALQIDPYSTLDNFGGSVTLAPAAGAAFMPSGTLAARNGGTTTLNLSALGAEPVFGSLRVGTLYGDQPSDGTLSLQGNASTNYLLQNSGTLAVQAGSTLTLNSNTASHYLDSGTWLGGGQVGLAANESLVVGLAGTSSLGGIHIDMLPGSGVDVLNAVNFYGSNSIQVQNGAQLNFDSSNSAGIQDIASIGSETNQLHIYNQGTVNVFGIGSRWSGVGSGGSGTLSLTGLGQLNIGGTLSGPDYVRGQLELMSGAEVTATGGFSLAAHPIVRAQDSALLNAGGTLSIAPAEGHSLNLQGTLATYAGGTTSLTTGTLTPTLASLFIGTDNRTGGVYGSDANVTLIGQASVNDFFQAGGTLNVSAGSTLTLTAAQDQWFDSGLWTGGGTIQLATNATSQWGYGSQTYLGDITVNFGTGSTTEILSDVVAIGDAHLNNSGTLNFTLPYTSLQGKFNNTGSISSTGQLSIQGEFTQGTSGAVTANGMSVSQTVGPIVIDGAITVGNDGLTLNSTGGGIVIGSTLGSTAQVTATGTGAIQLTGIGNGTQPHGVVIQGKVSTVSGAFTVTGTGGVRTVSNSTDVEAVVGVAIPGGTLQTTSGAITVTGTGGRVEMQSDPSPQHDLGVYLDQGAVIQSADGDIHVIGTGASGPWAQPSQHEASGGVVVDWGSTIQTAGAGQITLSGTASSATLKSGGVLIQKNSLVQTLGTGSVALTGEAAGATDTIDGKTVGVVVENARVLSGGALSVYTQKDFKVVAGHLGDTYTAQATSLESLGNQSLQAAKITLMGGESGEGLRAELISSGTQNISASNGMDLLAGQGGDTNLADTNNLGNWVSVKSEGDQTITVGGSGLTLAAGGGAGTDNAARIWNTGVTSHQSIALIGGASLTMTGGTSPQTNVGSTHGSQVFILADGLSQSIDFAGTGSISPGVLSLQGGSAGSRARAQIWAQNTLSTQSITGASLVSLQGGSGGGVSGEGNFAVMGGLGTVQTLDVGSISVIGGNGTLGTDFDNYAQIRWQNGTQTLLTSGNVTLQAGAVTGANAAIVAPVQRGTINGHLNLTGGAGGASTSPGSGTRLGGWNNGSGAATDILMTINGNVTLSGGVVTTSGAAIGNDGSAVATVIDLTIGGDLTMTPNASSTRIGSSSSAMGLGSIAIDAANITVGASSAINTAGDLSLLSAGTLASNGGIRGATVTAVAGNGVSIGAAGFFTGTSSSGTALVIDAGLGTFSSLRTSANTLGEVNGGMNVDTPNGGKWALYIADPAQLTNPGSINYAFKQYGGTRLGGESVLGSGNGVFFGSSAPNFTLTTAGTSKTYDASASISGLSVTATPVSGSDTLNATVSSALFSDKNAGLNKPLDIAYSLEVTDAVGKPVFGYASVGTINTIGTINPATLSASLSAQSKTYDGNTNATLSPSAFTLSGFVSGETASVTQTSGTYNSSNVIGASTVTANLGSLDFNAGTATLLSNYVLPSSASGAGTINPATLSASLSAQSKTYDGNTNATLSPSAFTLSGFVSGETASVTQTSGTYNSSNVIGASTVTANLGSLDFNAGTATLLSNYVLPSSASGAGTINPATLSASLSAQSKTYDGNTNATLSPSAFTLSGFVSGETASVTQTSGTYNSSNVIGASTVTANLGSLDFNAGTATLLSNYVLPSSASGAGTINPATLSASLSAQSKTYDGNTNATLSPSAFTLSGFVSGETASVTQTSGTYNSSNVIGASTVTANLGSLDFNAGTATLLSNYVLPSSASGAGTINPATLSASLSAQSKTYDGNTSATLSPSAFTLSGFVSGETASVTQTSGTYNSSNVIGASTVTANLGSLDFNAGTATLLSNYVLPSSASGAGTINPATLSASLSAQSKTYDGNTNATLSPSAFTLSGFVSGETASVTQTSGTYNSSNVIGASTVTANLGSLDFNAGTATLLSNYVLPSSASGAGTINPATLSASLSAQSKTYDGNTNATLSPSAFTLSGFVSGETASVTQTSGTYNSSNVIGASTVTANLGSLDFNAGTATLLSNYVLPSSASGAGTINPKALSIAGSSAQGRTYDGTTNASITAGTLSGLVGSETLSVSASGTFNSKNAGASTATASYTLADGTGGGLASNYGTLANSTGLTASITPASLTLSAATDSKVYDGSTASSATPIITSGTVFAGDSLTGLSQSFNSKNVQGANTLSVSNYALNDGNGGNNYAVTLQSATGSITQRPLSTWTGAGGNSLWSNPQNWDALPDLNNVAAVSLPAGSGSVVFDGSATAVTLLSLSNAGSLALDSTGLTLGALTNFGTTTINTTLTLGDVANSGHFTVASGTTTVASYRQSESVAGAVTTLGVSGGTTGTLSHSSGTVFIQAGTLAGKGQILGSLSVGAATVAPGFSPGNLAISGNLTLTGASTLSLELGDTTKSNSDSLTVGGTATLAGTLSLSSTLTYRPNNTNQFNLISAGDVTGTFAETQADSTLLASLSFSQLQMTVGGATLSIPSAITFASSNDDLLGSTADPLPDLTSTLVDAGSVTNTMLAPPTYDPTVSTDSLIPSATSSTTATSGATTTDTASSIESTTAPAPTSTQAADASTSGSTSEEDKKKEEEDKKKAASAETTPGQSTPAVIEPPSTAVTNPATDTSTPASLTTVRSGEVASLGIDPEPQANVPAAPSGNKEVTYAPTKSQDEKNSGGKPGPTSADEKC